MRIASALLAAFLLAACGTNRAPESRQPDVEIFVVMRDDFTYEPAEIEVRPGDVISFQVANAGQARHEFLIGTAEEHQGHENQMQEEAEHGAHESELKGVSVEPGKEKTFKFTVPRDSELLFGCHEPGHYEKGMKGNIRYRS